MSIEPSIPSPSVFTQAIIRCERVGVCHVAGFQYQLTLHRLEGAPHTLTCPKRSDALEVLTSLGFRPASNTTCTDTERAEEIWLKPNF